MIKIGIIDSGINVTDPNIAGVHLQRDPVSRELISSNDLIDEIGHGSDCFRIISSIIPDANYYIVKVFDKELVTDIGILSTAIQLCVDQAVDIINISAGVATDEIPEILRIACDSAYNNDTIIVSARHSLGLQCYPANYTKVISVGNIDLAEGEQFKCVITDNIECYTSAADMFPAGTAWSQASSFACAKMTGYVALALRQKGKLPLEKLKTELIIH
jgi:hypothetical protein